MGKNFKRFTSSLLAFLIVFQIFVVPVEAVGITATAGIAIDHDTGDVFYEKNADKMLVPASLTKILTAYIIYEEMEAGNLTKDTMIKVSPRAARMSRDRGYPMAVPLQAGASYSVDQFIKLIMIPSASASCYAVAEHISGTEAKFVERMNKTAKEIGMETRFTNSHGAKPHYTTARSVAKLVSHFIDKYPDILNYTSLPSFTFNGRRYNILNRFISQDRYEGADGFKTGTIPEAGYCLAATAKRNGRRVITVVLKSNSNNNRYNDSRKLLDLAFATQKKADQARNNTKAEFINTKDKVRLNTKLKAEVKLNNINQDYMSTGGWTLNGKVVDTFGKSVIKNNRILKTEMLIPKDLKEVKIGMYLNQPNGSKKEFTKEIKIDEKSPAMYIDADGNWAEEYIEKVSEKGLLGEVKKGYFGTDNKVKRADFITSIGRIVEFLEIEEIENKPSEFKDVKETDYFNKYVAWASDKNIIQGYNGKFSPKGEITRQEAAVIINKLLSLYDIELKEDGNKFKDDNEIKDWAKDSVKKVSSAKLINLGNENRFEPGKFLFRADLAYMVSQTLDLLEKNLNLVEEDIVEQGLEEMDKEDGKVVEETKGKEEIEETKNEDEKLKIAI